MNKSILVDFNNTAVRTLFSSEVLTYDPDNPKKVIDVDWNLWEYRLFDGLYKSLYNVKGAGEIVLAIDGDTYWRKVIWPKYKAKRREQREKLDFDWDLYFQRYQQFQEELVKYTPFKVLKENYAESDDIIAVICLHSPNNNHTEYHIISNDSDFIQLSRGNVKIYNPLKKSYVAHPSPELWLVETCLRGQAQKDNIYNVKTPLDYPEDKRKPPLGEKMAEKIIAGGYKKWLKDNKLEERFEINRNLIDFTRIPISLREKILKSYSSYVTPRPEILYDWIKDKNWHGILDGWFRVEGKLLEIY